MVMPGVFSLHSKPQGYTFSPFYRWEKLSLRKINWICSVPLKSQGREWNLKSSSAWPWKISPLTWAVKHVLRFERGKDQYFTIILWLIQKASCQLLKSFSLRRGFSSWVLLDLWSALYSNQAYKGTMSFCFKINLYCFKLFLLSRKASDMFLICFLLTKS